MKMVARFIPIVIMVLLVAALSASPVLADPGHKGGHGKGGKGGNNTQESATLTLAPNPVSASNSEYTVSASGLAANKYTVIGITHSATSWSTSWISLTTDSSGSFSFRWESGPEGEAKHDVYQAKGGGKLQLVTSAMLTITPEVDPY